jgi:hypothetical protein
MRKANAKPEPVEHASGARGSYLLPTSDARLEGAARQGPSFLGMARDVIQRRRGARTREGQFRPGRDDATNSRFGRFDKALHR